MRRYLQQGCRQLVGRHPSLLIFLFSTLVYLLTMDRTVSWWDCGEFIATGYGLQIGHPPGAPFYQLITHCAMLLSFGDPMWVAPLSNLVSVLCGSLTVMLLYKTILLLILNSKTTIKKSKLAAAVGALCYLFCDTAWFSAVESEVYSMAMLFCSLTVWLMLLWEREGDNRKLLLTALLLGLGICVHLMTLLTIPALLWIGVRRLRKAARESDRNWWLWIRTTLLGILFFIMGLTPYAIIPIRAASHLPINEGNPSTYERFKSYFNRDQYEKAPLYPRMWREIDSANWKRWGATDRRSFTDNILYYATYQLGYMYCRYFMYNFIGRENLRWNIVVLSVLPFLFGIWGLWRHCKRRRGDFCVVLLLFLFGGLLLNFYINHPCYEPRERDYAYVLSFYAFAIWIGIGAAELCEKWSKGRLALLLLAPLLLAVGNWSDHDRHNSHSVHDIALNHLQSCDHGALLFSLGDNDTFPLWYLQHVERRRTDIDIHNVNLTGYRTTMAIIADNQFRRPIYFTHYAYEHFKKHLQGHFRCEGFCWRLLPDNNDIDDIRPLQRHLSDSIQWNIGAHEYVDRISKSFLKIWEKNTRRQ